jgi:hypothetical protein
MKTKFKKQGILAAFGNSTKARFLACRRLLAVTLGLFEWIGKYTVVGNCYQWTYEHKLFTVVLSMEGHLSSWRRRGWLKWRLQCRESHPRAKLKVILTIKDTVFRAASWTLTDLKAALGKEHDFEDSQKDATVYTWNLTM